MVKAGGVVAAEGLLGGDGGGGRGGEDAGSESAAVDAAGKKRAILVDGSGAVVVATPIPGAVVTGQIKIVTTGTPVQLPTFPLRNGIVVKAGLGNAPQDPAIGYSATIGPAGITVQFDGNGNGYPLSPGEAGSFACADASNVWVNGTAGDIFAFEGN